MVELKRPHIPELHHEGFTSQRETDGRKLI